MKFEIADPPRVFAVSNGRITISDCGKIRLGADEQVTFVSNGNVEYDVARKSWGYYATPSINARLKSFGFRSALVKSGDGKHYVFLVESGQGSDFERYLEQEGHSVLVWLDDASAMATLEKNVGKASIAECLCGSSAFETVATFDRPSKTEVPFSFGAGQTYHRELLRCRSCGHFRSVHQMDDSKLYSGDYVSSNYGDGGIERAFNRIIGLDPATSDNVGRVHRVLQFAEKHFAGNALRSVLDIGSGLCVFLHRMKAASWNCTALDPDARAAEHAKARVGVEAIHGDFMKLKPSGTFDVVTLNRVLEHVHNPIAMLSLARDWLSPKGFLYLEVPDGEMAIDDADRADREEFTIDHPHVFSATSLSVLVSRAGFQIMELERLREPSGKYTLRAFVTPRVQEGTAGGRGEDVPQRQS